MPLRPFEQVRYIPFLSLRPAEMRAIQELPERDKDLLLPYFSIRAWMGAHYLDSALSRLEEAYGRRPHFVTIADAEPIEGERPVYAELDELRNSDNGYSAWYHFIEAHSNFIPALQLDEITQLRRQTERFYELGRGILVPIREAAFSQARNIADSVSSSTDRGRDVCFFLDFARASRDILMRQAQTLTLARTIFEAAPRSFVAISASSFPDSFAEITEQRIYERTLFDEVADQLGNPHLIYSDRGSARAERQTGGGGEIPPRVDYAERSRWRFFRSNGVGSRAVAYRDQAARLTASRIWDFTASSLGNANDRTNGDW